MNGDEAANKKEIPLRAHDITVCLEKITVPEFEQLQILGMATRMALHLRGAPAVKYEVIRDIAVYLLDFSSQAVRPVLELLAEAEFLRLVTEGRSIKTVIPDVPFYDRLFTALGEISQSENFSEHELFAIDLANRLARSPIARDMIYQIGAERQVVDRIIDIGSQGAFLSERRARGRDIIISPAYFAENVDAYTDLVAGHGAQRVKKVLDLLKQSPGWPLKLIASDHEIGGVQIDEADVAVVSKLAGEGFISPPAIETSHAGTNHFLFGPRPGHTSLPAFKKPVYEAAMALVAAMRQGQCLPAKYAIKSPYHLLAALRDRGYINANSEAFDQYRQLATLRVGKLVHIIGDRYKFELIQRPENYEAIDIAIMMVSGEQMQPKADEDIILALRRGETYIESLIGRKRLIEFRTINIDPEAQGAIDDFLLRGQM